MARARGATVGAIGVVMGLTILLGVGGCAVFTCEPRSVLVAKKEERSRAELVPRGFRTTETGRVEEIRELEVVREYWIRSEDGMWHRVTAEQFQAAEIGRPMDLCR